MIYSPMISAAQVRNALTPLSMRELDILAQLSSVPAATLYKIKLGITKNPRLETIRKFLPHISAARGGGA